MLSISKFGGSSLADSAGFRRVQAILEADPARRGAVVSAPGRRTKEDEKITDLLYYCYDLRRRGGDWREVFAAFADRVAAIVRDLALAYDVRDELARLESEVSRGVTQDYLVSRGEYFSARILASLLGWQFLDSAAWLRFTPDGSVDTVRSYGTLRKLAALPFVTPGFYGRDAGGNIRTFTRGGSDISGALAAAALDADLYENFTDVPGLLEADPALVPDAAPVRNLTYAELGELCRVGTQVLHEGTVKPLRDSGIPMRIRSTWQPDDPGTLIAPTLSAVQRRTALCLAVRRGRALLSLSNGGSGALEAALSAVRVAPDFTTAAFGRETASIPSDALHNAVDALAAQKGEYTVRDDLALIAVLFDRTQPGADAAKLLSALRESGVAVETILRPFDSRTLLLAVPDGDAPRAVHALQKARPG